MNTQVNQTNKTRAIAAGDFMQQDQKLAIKVQVNGHSARIVMSGCFDFQVRLDFRNAYMPLLDNAAVQEILVEMCEVGYMDSSAMGMLLLLNERAQAANKSVVLLTTFGFVSQAFDVANFSEIINIRHIGPGNRSFLGLPAVMVNDSLVAA